MIKKEKRHTLKELRVNVRLTQPEVEEITAKKDRRIPQSTLSDWESGKKETRCGKHIDVIGSLQGKR